ncbi:MAG: SUMF1/EgtB/PvdO family nonheme iron enzyme [Verrucomicrobiota bacterium]|jgi:formylglycine-generating enzyme required for sulfatase activity
MINTKDQATSVDPTTTNSLRWTNSLQMEFVPIPGTEVMFSIWDTRVSDYQAYANTNSGVDPGWKEPGFPQDQTHPAVNVSWDNAQAFCAWLTKKERREGKIRAGQRYRLPTDAEWSVAVGLQGERAGMPDEKNVGVQGVYPWGTQFPPPKGAGNYSPSLGVDDYDYTSPVGSFDANQHGLYDMGGNVLQWCEDWYDGQQECRVLRGASWGNYGSTNLLSSRRFKCSPGDFCNSFAFRCVLV